MTRFTTSNVITIDIFVSDGSYDVATVVLICKLAIGTMKEHSVENTKKEMGSYQYV